MGSRAAGAAAAVLALAAAFYLVRPGEAAAAHFLQAVKTTWTEVLACHRVTVMSSPLFSRTEEAWFVRGKGGASKSVRATRSRA